MQLRWREERPRRPASPRLSRAATEAQEEVSYPPRRPHSLILAVPVRILCTPCTSCRSCFPSNFVNILWKTEISSFNFRSFRFTENWVQRVSFPYTPSPPPPSTPKATYLLASWLVWYIFYDRWTNIDALLLTKFHRLCESSVVVFDECVMSHIHHYSAILSSFIALKFPCSTCSSTPPTLNLWQSLIFLLPT